MKHKDFAVFIMVHGRPDKMWTYNSLRKQGYTGKIFLVGDNLDKTIPEYRLKYGDELIVFDKNKASLKVDSGDNSGDLRSTLYAANEIFNLAEERGIEYFYIMCDDYYYFGYRYETGARIIKNLDNVFDIMVDFYKSVNIKSLCFSQGGDHIGGFSGIKMKRKAMNSFLCSPKRRFKFMGRMNEDVTTYTNLGQGWCIFYIYKYSARSERSPKRKKRFIGYVFR